MYNKVDRLKLSYKNRRNEISRAILSLPFKEKSECVDSYTGRKFLKMNAISPGLAICARESVRSTLKRII